MTVEAEVGWVSPENSSDAWDERYIYPHEWLIFWGINYNTIGKYTGLVPWESVIFVTD